MWNAKGKKMMEAARGEILNEYGAKGWELVSVIQIDDGENYKFFFKKEDE